MNLRSSPFRTILTYSAGIISIFFALIVVAGRIYTQSYWKVFGLTTTLIDNQLVNYAIVSPNMTLTIVFLSLAIAFIIVMFWQKPYDFIGDSNPTVIYFAGFLFFLLGLFVSSTVPKLDTSTWTNGTVGLVVGLGYVASFLGQNIWLQATFKLQKEKPNLNPIGRFLKSLPNGLIQILFALMFLGGALWGIFSIAQEFGSNEAKMFYNTQPSVNIHVDSSKGFEDITNVFSPGDVVIPNVKIIRESGSFLYFTNGPNKSQTELIVRGIPSSRVVALQYNLSTSPLGK